MRGETDQGENLSHSFPRFVVAPEVSGGGVHNHRRISFAGHHLRKQMRPHCRVIGVTRCSSPAPAVRRRTGDLMAEAGNHEPPGQFCGARWRARRTEKADVAWKKSPWPPFSDFKIHSLRDPLLSP